MNPTALSNLNLNIIPNAQLSGYTTFRLGGNCKGLILCQTPEELELAVTSLIQQKEKFILIGGGSNLVVSDHGLDCYVIRYVSETPIIKIEGEDIIVSGSTNLDQLALFSAEHGLNGLIYTSGIPGTVGGAIVGNAGAFGKQVGDVLKNVTVLTASGIKKTIDAKDIEFSYRDSSLKKSGNIIVSARFGLSKGDCASLFKERAELLAVRAEKHPNLQTHPCAGSFFRNIEPTSKAGKRQAAGWFLEQAGGKNLSFGGAKIFDKHANIIVKGNDCKSQDVFELSKLMQKVVKEHFQLDLIREVRFVGRFANQPDSAKEVVW